MNVLLHMLKKKEKGENTHMATQAIRNFGKLRTKNKKGHTTGTYSINSDL